MCKTRKARGFYKKLILDEHSWPTFGFHGLSKGEANAEQKCFVASVNSSVSSQIHDLSELSIEELSEVQITAIASGTEKLYFERAVHWDHSAFDTGFEKHRDQIGAGYAWQNLYRVQDSTNFNPNFSPRPDLTNLMESSDINLPTKAHHRFSLFAQDDWGMVTLALKNIFDDDVREPSPGRNGYLEVSYRFWIL